MSDRTIKPLAPLDPEARYAVQWRSAEDHGHRTFDRWHNFWEGQDLATSIEKAQECYALQWRDVQIVVVGWPLKKPERG